MPELPSALELERLASELEQSVPRLAPDDASAYPKPITVNDNGTASQWHRCAQHGPFLKTRLSGVPEWMGACCECEADSALVQKARALLPARSADLQRLTADYMEGCEDEISARVEEQLVRYVAELKPQIRQAIASEYGQQARAQAELDLVAMIVEELKAGE